MTADLASRLRERAEKHRREWEACKAWARSEGFKEGSGELVSAYRLPDADLDTAAAAALTAQADEIERWREHDMKASRAIAAQQTRIAELEALRVRRCDKCEEKA